LIMVSEIIMSEGRLEAIWIKRMKRGPMDSKESASLVAGRGLVGNANQGGKRQVTIIENEVWDNLMEQLDGELAPSARRANLMVKGVRLENSRGRILRVGGCRIRIYGETRPCERMEEAMTGLRDAMRPGWGGGAFGEVLDTADIRVGDTVNWED
jgi:MOSC domain-containing protein YiiM